MANDIICEISSAGEIVVEVNAMTYWMPNEELALKADKTYVDNQDAALTAHLADYANYIASQKFTRITVARDLTVAGEQTIQIPWKPKALIVFAGVNGDSMESNGFVISENNYNAVVSRAKNGWALRTETYAIGMSVDATNHTRGGLIINEDNITINWQIIGTGATGTATIFMLAMR